MLTGNKYADWLILDKLNIEDALNILEFTPTLDNLDYWQHRLTDKFNIVSKEPKELCLAFEKYPTMKDYVDAHTMNFNFEDDYPRWENIKLEEYVVNQQLVDKIHIYETLIDNMSEDVLDGYAKKEENCQNSICTMINNKRHSLLVNPFFALWLFKQENITITDFFNEVDIDRKTDNFWLALTDHPIVAELTHIINQKISNYFIRMRDNMMVRGVLKFKKRQFIDPEIFVKHILDWGFELRYYRMLPLDQIHKKVKKVLNRFYKKYGTDWEIHESKLKWYVGETIFEKCSKINWYSGWVYFYKKGIKPTDFNYLLFKNGSKSLDIDVKVLIKFHNLKVPIISNLNQIIDEKIQYGFDCSLILEKIKNY